MVEMTKKQKKGSISEEDMSTLLQRYTATTVLTLLQEVAQVPDVKIDWNELVKKTTTGISNAKEYQMLWRHLAYRDSLLERLVDEAEPLDDDSDLEYELEAFPTVSSEASMEAAACVKVLIASGLPSDSCLNGSTVEAPLTINIPNGQSSRAPSVNAQLASFGQGTNITVPVSVQKQPLPTMTSAEVLDANGPASGSLPPRRKRKPWSTAEDMELIAAVQKCGEGNWANILKGDFKGDRTASQLSQRWAIIRKRKGGNLNVGGGSQLSEAQLAARRAVSLALNMPMGDNLKAACSIGGTNSNSLHLPAAEALSVGAQSQHQSQQDPNPTIAHRSGAPGSLSKSRVTSKKPSTKSALSPDALVKAAAFAAGARIATPSDAASLLKAAQAKNAVHIMPGGGSLIKSSVAGNANPLPSPHLGLPPNVHFIRTGLAATPPSTHSSAVSPNASEIGGTQQGNSVKPAAPTVQLNPASTAPELNPSSEAINAATSIPTIEIEVTTAKDVIFSSGSPPKELIQEDQAAVIGNAPREQVEEDQAAFMVNTSKEQVEEDQASVSVNTPTEHVQKDQASVLGDASNKQVQEDQNALPSSETILKCQTDFVANVKCVSSAETAGNDQTIIIGKHATAECKNTNDDNMMGLLVKNGGDNQSAVKEICANQRVNWKQEDLSSMSEEKVDIMSKAAAETETGGEVK